MWISSSSPALRHCCTIVAEAATTDFVIYPNKLATSQEGFIHSHVFLLCCFSGVVSALPSRYVPCFSSLCFELLDFLDELLLSLQRLKQHTGMSIQKLE